MNKRTKKGLIVSIIVIAIVVIGILLLNFFVKNKLKNSIDTLSGTVKMRYKDINVNCLTGSVAIINPVILVYGNTTHAINAEIELKKIAIHGVSYWHYFFNNKINIKDILLNDPKIRYHHNDLASLKSSKKSYKDDFKMDIEVEAIEMTNGTIEILNVPNDSLMLTSEAINLKVNSVSFKKSNLKNKIPVTFKDYKFTCSNLFYKLNDYENLLLKHADFNTNSYKISKLSIKTKYSKEELSKKIDVERDHFDINIDSILVKEPNFGIKNDSLFYFESQQVDMYQPNLEVYRDKLVADDPSYKPLYSKSLRALNFDLTLSTVLLKNASIVYTEKVKEETHGGRLMFTELNATITDLSNTYKVGNKTSADIHAVFMEEAPIKVNWDFDVNNESDEFVFKGDIGKLEAEKMNQFMEPNLNVRLNGIINKTYFTINGMDKTSLIDLKLKYDNFRVNVLKQNGKEKNKFLSGLVNLFVSKNSEDKSDDFRFGNAKDIERDNAKSVFNYLWLNIKAGLLNAMTGDGVEN